MSRLRETALVDDSWPLLSSTGARLCTAGQRCLPRRSHVFLTRRVNVEGGHSKGIGMWRAGDSRREPRTPSRCVCGSACWLGEHNRAGRQQCAVARIHLLTKVRNGNSRHQDPDAGAARTTYSHLIAEFGPQSSAPPPPPGNGTRRDLRPQLVRLLLVTDGTHEIGILCEPTALSGKPAVAPSTYAAQTCLSPRRRRFCGRRRCALIRHWWSPVSARPAVLCRQHSERACIVCNRSNFCYGRFARARVI